MLNKILDFLTPSNPSNRDIKEAYIGGNMRKLRVYFRKGKPHIKMQVLRYLGSSDSQSNLDFLAGEMRECKDEKLKAGVLTAMFNMLKNDKRFVSTMDEQYMKAHDKLIDKSDDFTTSRTGLMIDPRVHSGKSASEYKSEQINRNGRTF